jgi:hypothetical protein
MRILLTILFAAQIVFAGGSVFNPQPTGDPAVSGGVRSVGLGGAGLAIWDSLGIHGDNAAAAANMTGTMLRAGIRTGLYAVSDKNSSDSDTEFGWQAFRLYLNVHPRYKMGFAIDPIATTDFKTYSRDSLTERQVSASDTATLLLRELYERRTAWLGSNTSLRWDNAIKLNDKLAIGWTAGFAMTYLETNYRLDFDSTRHRYDFVAGSRDDSVATKASSSHDVNYRDVQRFKGFWGGLSIIAKPADKWTVAAYWNTEADGNWQTENSINNGRQFEAKDISGTRPGEFGAGVGYHWAKNWAAYADFKQQSWKAKQFGPQFENTNVKDVDAFAIMLGAEKLGGTRITDEGFDRWDYRAGIAYRKQPWQVITASGSEDVNEVALSLGVSIPLAQQTGKLHTALDFGQRSASDADVTELFTRFYLQLDLHEQWFKREQRKLRD